MFCKDINQNLIKELMNFSDNWEYFLVIFENI